MQMADASRMRGQVRGRSVVLCLNPSVMLPTAQGDGVQAEADTANFMQQTALYFIAFPQTATCPQLFTCERPLTGDGTGGGFVTCTL